MHPMIVSLSDGRKQDGLNFSLIAWFKQACFGKAACLAKQGPTCKLISKRNLINTQSKY